MTQCTILEHEILCLIKKRTRYIFHVRNFILAFSAILLLAAYIHYNDWT